MWRVGALLLLLVVMLAGCSSGTAARPRVRPSPSPLASPSPLPAPSPAPDDHGPVPAGVPVFYAGAPDAPDWLTALDWNGVPVGTLKLPAGVAAQPARSAPGGGTLWVGGTFYDRSGRSLGSVPITDKTVPVWADDGSRVCALRPVGDPMTGFRYQLWTAAVGGPLRAVAIVGPETQVGQVGEDVLACSGRRDLAIVVRTAIAWPTDVWYVRLSTGAVVGHTSYPGQWLSTVVASTDTRYVAENASGFQGQAGQSGAPSTLIREVDTGAVVGTLGDRQVLAFSPDDGAVLTMRGTGPWTLAVSDLHGGGALGITSSDVLVFAVARPDGHDFAVFGAHSLLILRAGGGSAAVPGDFRASVLG